MIVEEQDIFKIIKENASTSMWVHRARAYSKTLKALILGKDYVDELIQIDHQESEKKIKARQKYTFSTKDLSKRLLSNTEAIWSAQGGSKVYGHLDDEGEKEKLIKAISNVRGGKNLEQWNEAFWMPLYITDPAGVSNLEYNSEKGIDPFPVNYSINEVRNYLSNGVNVEWILFEPITIKNENGTYKEWRFIDDAKDYSIKESSGENGTVFSINEAKTFENPFKQPACLINSDIVDPESYDRLSPFDDVVETLKEYLRDKSIKTIFKFLQGFPIFWRYVTYCTECTGTGVDNNNNSCKSCNGSKIVGRRDVTDSVDMPVPTADSPVLDKIADWAVPPLEIWDQYTKELQLHEKTAMMTAWGAIIDVDKSDTATGRMIDVQPIIQRLNKFSHAAEVREKKQTEWYDLYLNPLTEKEDQRVSINLGRNYALLPADTILDVYEKSKEKGDNNTILDELFHQYLLSKYKNDPVNHQLAVLKAETEPYLHYSVDKVAEIFGTVEAQKKILFQGWWDNVTTQNKSSLDLKKEYLVWFNENKVEVNKKEE